jgi:membrane protein YdbS with pleckstrin-like domain
MATVNTTGGVNENDPLTGDPVPHKPADDREQIYYQGSPLLRGEMAKGWIWVLLGLCVIAIPILLRLFYKNGQDAISWWVLLAGFVVGLILIFVPWLKTKTISYKITNYRIDVEKGLIGRRIDTMELWHVEDISMNQGVLERILGVGTVVVMSHDDTTPKLAMRGLPNPRPLFDTLKQRVIAVKRQRGVVKMDIG